MKFDKKLKIGRKVYFFDIDKGSFDFAWIKQIHNDSLMICNPYRGDWDCKEIQISFVFLRISEIYKFIKNFINDFECELKIDMKLTIDNAKPYNNHIKFDKYE